MTKGWCSPKWYRCGATHYVHPHDGTRSLCGRSPIRLTAQGVMEMTKDIQKKYANIEVCDWCQHERRK